MKIDEEKDGEEKKQNKNKTIKIITLEVRRRKKQGQDEYRRKDERKEHVCDPGRKKIIIHLI